MDELRPQPRRRLAGLRSRTPRDPIAFLRHIDRLCWRLTVFRTEDGCCTGDLELWTDGTIDQELCEFFGLCLDHEGRHVSPPAHLVPADRRRVLARHPGSVLPLKAKL